MGYVIKGKVAYRSQRGEQVFEAGDAYATHPTQSQGRRRTILAYRLGLICHSRRMGASETGSGTVGWSDLCSRPSADAEHVPVSTARSGGGRPRGAVSDDARSPKRTLAMILRAAARHRTTGHAAEMAFFAVLTLVPSTVAVGSALGLSESVIGTTAVAEAERSAIRAVSVLMGPQIADTVVAPFVHAQLTQPNGGVALGSLLLAWWLSSHLFAATAHALDTIYGVTDRRPGLVQRLIALAFALGSVVVVALTADLMVVGPLGESRGGVVGRIGLGEEYAVLWSILRWPVLMAVLIACLVSLYRFSPNVRHSWRHCVPGAIMGAALWILAAAAFRLATEAGIRFASGVTADDPRVTLIGESVSAVVATALWAYLASIAILLGGELNAMRPGGRADLEGHLVRSPSG